MKKQLWQLKWMIVFAMVLFSSCSPKTIYFTQEIRNKVEEQGLDLRDVQFYNSHPITLQRNLTYEETKLASGTINFENGRYIEIIQIKKETPGICEQVEPKSLDITFEAGDNRRLKFVMNPRKNYQISALEWRDRLGKVNYDTLTYYIKPGGEKALLKVKNDKIFKLDKKERVATGRKVAPSNN
ncbi:MAG: hypothetical protein PF694_14640 [Bacteroidetes bacterium]|jgi:hypothetical protein|nr:hypothetical protein [Bacteroidota bacterium]